MNRWLCVRLIQSTGCLKVKQTWLQHVKIEVRYCPEASSTQCSSPSSACWAGGPRSHGHCPPCCHQCLEVLLQAGTLALSCHRHNATVQAAPAPRPATKGDAGQSRILPSHAQCTPRMWTTTISSHHQHWAPRKLPWAWRHGVESKSWGHPAVEDAAVTLAHRCCWSDFSHNKDGSWCVLGIMLCSSWGTERRDAQISWETQDTHFPCPNRALLPRLLEQWGQSKQIPIGVFLPSKQMPFSSPHLQLSTAQGLPSLLQQPWYGREYCICPHSRKDNSLPCTGVGTYWTTLRQVTLVNSSPACGMFPGNPAMGLSLSPAQHSAPALLHKTDPWANIKKVKVNGTTKEQLPPR